jgi:HTH-type transcriptional regulator/antitoxin HigA
VKVFPLQPIETKARHEVSLKILEKLISYTNDEKAKKTDEKGIEIYLKTLTELVAEYEREEFKAGTVSGAEMLAYMMELQGLNQADLSKELGGQPVVSKILKGERELNLRQVKALAKRFKISPEVFI